MSARDISVFQPICNEIKKRIPPEGISRDENGSCLLILRIPLKRHPNSGIEKVEYRAFAILNDLTRVGEAMGILDGSTGKYCTVHLLGQPTAFQPVSWRDLEILPVDVREQMTRDFARKTSGIAVETSDFRGVLAGVGALGGALADLWFREACGDWTLIDPDYIKPHNISRHIGKNFQTGHYKVDAAKLLLEANYFSGYCNVNTIADSVTTLNDTKLQEVLSTADFLVEATTTLEVPRYLSGQDNAPRCASAFLTPSGFGSALLVEDSERTVRLESLEAQYYRAVINNDWGVSHLKGHLGYLWVGAGCRDVSTVISFELIQLHAATLARHIRIARDRPEPLIRVWESDPETGALSVYNSQVFAAISSESNSWRILWDSGIRDKLYQFRERNLPNETGGVILGFIDQTVKTISVVDILSSPPDSESNTDSYIRGVTGLNERIDQAANRTANIVGYIGEWHSHPSNYSARPSSTDRKLIHQLAETLSDDGQPALMIIVGETDVTVTVKEL